MCSPNNINNIRESVQLLRLCRKYFAQLYFQSVGDKGPLYWSYNNWKQIILMKYKRPSYPLTYWFPSQQPFLSHACWSFSIFLINFNNRHFNNRWQMFYSNFEFPRKLILNPRLTMYFLCAPCYHCSSGEEVRPKQ